MLQHAIIVRAIERRVKRHDVQLVDEEEDICCTEVKPNEEDNQSLSGLVSTNKQNLLATASARLIYGDKECPVQVLQDSGSQETFLRTTIGKDLKVVLRPKIWISKLC